MTTDNTLDTFQQYKWARECDAARLMSRQGGGFAGAIADAYFRADSGNKTILVNAFRDLFDKYARLAEQDQAA